MDSRERTFLALDHQEADRIPVDFWASRGFAHKLQAGRGLSLDEFKDAHDVDLRYIAGPRYTGPPLEGPAPDLSMDIWGVTRRAVDLDLAGGTEQYNEVDYSPLAEAKTVEDVLDYPNWPDPDNFDYDVIEAQCDEIIARGRVVVFQGDRLNRIAQLKPAMYIRGVEQILLDLAMNGEIAKAILGRIHRFYMAYLDRIMVAANGKIDIVLTGDDFGSQNGLLVSPGMWDEFLGDGFARYMDLIKSYGARTMHHTCGSVVPIIGRLIDRGLDVLQSVQPEAADMAPDGLKQQFGQLISFHGGMSIQRTMTFGTAQDVRDQVEHLAQTLGRGGGYIFCTAHNVQADAPVENIEALMAAYKEFGAYS